MHVCVQLVELMNGQIELISEYGHGSTFRICVPISKAPAGYERASASPTPPSVPTPLELETAPGEMDVDEAALRKRKPRRRPEEVRVLLAEDNKLIRDIVTKTLKAMKVSRSENRHVSSRCIQNLCIVGSSTSTRQRTDTSASSSSRRNSTMSS